jgi:hypothetical protein
MTEHARSSTAAKYDQTVCPRSRGGALLCVGLPIADKADYFRSSCKLYTPPGIDIRMPVTQAATVPYHLLIR